MQDFSEVFDLKKLGDHEIDHLRWVLTSPSYDDCFRPYMVGIRDSLALKLLDPSGMRKDAYPDDFLRGGIIMVDGLLNLFNRLVTEAEAERVARINQRDLTPAQEYEVLRKEGKITAPGTALVPDEPEYNPDEDY